MESTLVEFSPDNRFIDEVRQWCASDNRRLKPFSLTLPAVPTIRRERRCIPLLVVSIRRKVLEIIVARLSLPCYHHAFAHSFTG